MSYTDWNIHLNNLVEYCNSQDVNILFKPGCTDEYDVDECCIKINSRRTKRNQVYLLLHEMGHHKVIKNKKFAKKFACLNESYVPRNLSNRVRTLEEEVFAWHMGENIAEKLDIPLDESYQVLKSKCLKSYADWIS